MNEIASRLKERGCEGKVRMGESAARKLAHRAHQDGDHRIGAYRCMWCRTWHIGHIPDMATVELMARVIRGLD